jgi:hypothetical protein
MGARHGLAVRLALWLKSLRCETRFSRCQPPPARAQLAMVSQLRGTIHAPCTRHSRRPRLHGPQAPAGPSSIAAAASQPDIFLFDYGVAGGAPFIGCARRTAHRVTACPFHLPTYPVVTGVVVFWGFTGQQEASLLRTLTRSVEVRLHLRPAFRAHELSSYSAAAMRTCAAHVAWSRDLMSVCASGRAEGAADEARAGAIWLPRFGNRAAAHPGVGQQQGGCPSWPCCPQRASLVTPHAAAREGARPPPTEPVLL